MEAALPAQGQRTAEPVNQLPASFYRMLLRAAAVTDTGVLDGTTLIGLVFGKLSLLQMETGNK